MALNMTQFCLKCKKPVIALRSTRKFCNATCRKAFQRLSVAEKDSYRGVSVAQKTFSVAGIEGVRYVDESHE